jgi:hypothetical protein
MTSLEELSGSATLVGNHVRVSMMRRERVSQIQIVWQQHESSAGPSYHPSRPWGGPSLAFGRLFVGNDAAPGRTQWCAIEIKSAVNLGPGRQFWINSGATE